MSVNTNSKYKEDDFTDSDAVDFSQDVCIYVRPWSTHMSPSLLRSLLTPLHIPARQSDWNTRDDHNPVSGSNPGSFMVMMQIPSHQQTMLTSSSILFQEFQNYQANIETHSLILETDKTTISPLFQEFQNCQANIETHSLIFETDKTMISPPPYPKPGVSETCCSSSWWSAPPSWSSTNMFQLMFVNSFLCSFLTNQFYSAMGKYFNTFVFLK